MFDHLMVIPPYLMVTMSDHLMVLPLESIEEEMPLPRTKVSQWKLSPICGSSLFVNRASSLGGAYENDHVLLRVRGNGDSPVHWRHTCGGFSAQGCSEHRLRHSALRAWPIDRCSHKDADRSERKTPTLANVKNLTSEHVHHTKLSTTELSGFFLIQPEKHVPSWHSSVTACVVAQISVIWGGFSRALSLCSGTS